MSPATEELLYFLMWTADSMLRPTRYNLERSFEEWAWHNHLAHRLAQLERLKLIKVDPEPDLERIIRLTEAGRALALGGRDPASQWSRSWDGCWRLVMFDVPESQYRVRLRLWRQLRSLHFGCLQGSVWISPDSADHLRAGLSNTPVETSALIVIEGKPATGESDQDVVAGAWTFDRINKLYRRHIDFLDKPCPRNSAMADWLSQEARTWRGAVALDPLLPRSLWPAGYLGFTAFQRRREVFARLGPPISRSG